MTLLRVVLFSLAVVGLFTLFANILPQVESRAPREEKIDADTLDRAGQIAWGQRLFSGRGTCTLCHNERGRAPDLLALNLGREFSQRLTDPGYRGKAHGTQGAAAVEAYLRESLLEPSAYVVPGFGKKGTNDTVSPMPDVAAPPISLGETEIDALIAFFQDRAGVEPTVPLPARETGEVAAAEDEENEQEDAEEALATTPEAALEKFGCPSCHDLGGSGAEVGPKLAGVGQRLGREGVRQAILDPDAQIADGFEAELMPPDFGQQMRAGELELLVDYLMSLDAEGSAS